MSNVADKLVTVESMNELYVYDEETYAKKDEVMSQADEILKLTTTYYEEVENLKKLLTDYTHYKAGQVVNYSLNTSGFITNGQKSVLFFIPLNKIIDDTTIEASITKMDIKIRQNNKYLLGSATNTIDTSNYTSLSVTSGGLNCKIILDSALDGINNDTVGIEVYYVITFKSK